MRRPKTAGKKKAPAEPKLPGGRAWARVQQFALARGLPVEPAPNAAEAAPEPKPARSPAKKKRPAKKTSGA